jgi:hypothetical protein
LKYEKTISEVRRSARTTTCNWLTLGIDDRTAGCAAYAKLT